MLKFLKGLALLLCVLGAGAIGAYAILVLGGVWFTAGYVAVFLISTDAAMKRVLELMAESRLDGDTIVYVGIWTIGMGELLHTAATGELAVEWIATRPPGKVFEVRTWYRSGRIVKAWMWSRGGYGPGTQVVTSIDPGKF